jgi:hypothetical protein
MIARAVYLLCALTSASCAWLLLRGYLKNRTRLLLWSGLSFAALAANNALLFIDLVIVPDIDLSLVRAALSLFGVLILLGGLVWEGE